MQFAIIQLNASKASIDSEVSRLQSTLAFQKNQPDSGKLVINLERAIEQHIKKRDSLTKALDKLTE